MVRAGKSRAGEPTGHPHGTVLEVNSSQPLDLPLESSLRCNLTERRSADVRVRSGESRRVQCVARFDTEFESYAFRNAGAFAERRIDQFCARRSDFGDIARHIAEWVWAGR